ncbi:MAG: tetratricopeptide repeat protein, partial [Myxococcales bacterium]|nr:tetratricopeptide repeat protein [Myxococcales bacterium]
KTGFVLFFLLPMLATPVISAVVMCCAWLTDRGWLRAIAYVVLLALFIGQSLYNLAFHPPIFAFNAIGGYFAGSIYDEALALPEGLLAFRLFTTALSLLIVGGLSLAARRVRGQGRLTQAVGVVFLAGLVCGLWAFRYELRFESTRADIIEDLGGQYQSEHFIIYYALSDSSVARDIERVAQDHEFHYAQLREFFGVEPELPVRSFIYASSGQKSRMMGAGRTLIAKPWLGEIHITYEGVGEGALRHELAHVFSEAFGTGPLKTAGGLWQLNMGLVEGAATAAAWDAGQLTYHGWAAAIDRLDMAPDMTSIVGAAGFWSQFSGMAYTLMGSFSRWLIDEYGAEPFRLLYESGDFQASYGRSMDELLAGWEAFLRAIPLSESQLSIAEHRYQRSSIFGKRCARAQAERAEQAGELAAAERYDDAAECIAQAVDDDPENPDFRLAYAEFLLRAERYDDAQAQAERVAGEEGYSTLNRNVAREYLGDIAWLRGDLQGAAREYGQIDRSSLTPGRLRQLTVKVMAVDDPRLRPFIAEYLLEFPQPRPEATVLRLSEGYRRYPHPLLAYLVGLRLFYAGDYELAVGYLSIATEAMNGETPERFDVGEQAILRNALRYLGRSRYFLFDWDGARDAFSRLAGMGNPEIDAFAAEAQQWIERVDWTAERITQESTVH